jgi:hypothetical protein
MLTFVVLYSSNIRFFYENQNISLVVCLLIPPLIILTGSICTFIRKAYGLTITAAILSVVIGFLMWIFYGLLGLVFSLLSVLPLVFLIKRKEEFSK